LVPRLLTAKDPEMLSFILFFGFSQVIEAVATIAFGTSERSIPGGELGAALAAAASLLTGHEVENGPIEVLGQTFPASWVASGIDVHRVSAIAFGVGLALAAVAGVFAPFMLGSITPAMGVDVTVTSFTVIVIGSLGNPLGTVLGGLIYGVSYMFMQSYFSSWA